MKSDKLCGEQSFSDILSSDLGLKLSTDLLFCRQCLNAVLFLSSTLWHTDRLCGIVVRVPGYRSRSPGFDSGLYQIF
jgi:hypothetical protein